MATHTTLTSLFTDIADELRLKKGTSETIVADNFPTEIHNLPSGGTSDTTGVFFIDYDGTELEFWGASTVSSKISLPDNPTHIGLTSQGWNWTLQAIKDYIEDYPEANVYVGQTYATTSGLTEFDIVLTKATGLTVTCNMVGNKNWGDGSEEDNLTSHTYENYGNYTITCDGTSIPKQVFSQSSSSPNCFCTEIRLGNNISITNEALSYCYSIKSITIPLNISYIGNLVFSRCYRLICLIFPIGYNSQSNVISSCFSLKYVSYAYNTTSISAMPDSRNLNYFTIPINVTTIPISLFNNCYGLKKIFLTPYITEISQRAISYIFIFEFTIPSTVTIIGYEAFANSFCITNLIFPSGITNINTGAFYNCSSIIKYDFSTSTSVPTLANVSAFSGINGLCKIIVPDSLYDDWVVANNWSTYADYIVKASEYEGE